MIRTFQQLRMVDPGFTDPASLQTLRIAIPDSFVADPHMVVRLENNIADKLAAIPGVTSVGFAQTAPMEGDGHGWNLIYVEGKTYAGDPPIRLLQLHFSGILSSLSARDSLQGATSLGMKPTSGVPRVIVSENLAREEWGSAAAAIGKRMREAPGEPWYEVIGVVQDVRYDGVGSNEPPPSSTGPS